MSGQEKIDTSALEERDNSYLLVFCSIQTPRDWLRPTHIDEGRSCFYSVYQIKS